MMRRTFLELPAFTRLVKARQLSDVEVTELQTGIMRGGGSTMPGTAGLKKIRCGTSGRGKRGGWRVVFADYDRLEMTVLIWAYPKGMQGDLTAVQKRQLRAVKKQIDDEMEARYGQEG